MRQIIITIALVVLVIIAAVQAVQISSVRQELASGDAAVTPPAGSQDAVPDAAQPQVVVADEGE